MAASIEFLKELANSLKFNIIQVENGNNIYEFTAESYPESVAVVIVILEIENELLDSAGNHMGYFGIDYVYGRVAYYAFNNSLSYI